MIHSTTLVHLTFLTVLKVVEMWTSGQNTDPIDPNYVPLNDSDEKVYKTYKPDYLMECLFKLLVRSLKTRKYCSSSSSWLCNQQEVEFIAVHISLVQSNIWRSIINKCTWIHDTVYLPQLFFMFFAAFFCSIPSHSFLLFFSHHFRYQWQGRRS